MANHQKIIDQLTKNRTKLNDKRKKLEDELALIRNEIHQIDTAINALSETNTMGVKVSVRQSCIMEFLAGKNYASLNQIVIHLRDNGHSVDASSTSALLRSLMSKKLVSRIGRGKYARKYARK